MEGKARRWTRKRPWRWWPGPEGEDAGSGGSSPAYYKDENGGSGHQRKSTSAPKQKENEQDGTVWVLPADILVFVVDRAVR